MYKYVNDNWHTFTYHLSNFRSWYVMMAWREWRLFQNVCEAEPPCSLLLVFIFSEMLFYPLKNTGHCTIGVHDYLVKILKITGQKGCYMSNSKKIKKLQARRTCSLVNTPFPTIFALQPVLSIVHPLGMLISPAYLLAKSRTMKKGLFSFILWSILYQHFKSTKKSCIGFQFLEDHCILVMAVLIFYTKSH